MPVELKNLTIAVWVYDIDNYCIHWANKPALALWESDSLEELCSRDFKPITSKAVAEGLLEYQRAFKKGDALFTQNWHYSPRGIKKSAFCQFSGYVLDDGRMAMLVEALPVSPLTQDMPTDFTAMLSDYSADGAFISGNPPFIEAMGHEIAHFHDLIVDPSALKTIYRSLSQSGRYEDDVLMKSIDGETRWYHLIAVSVQSASEKGKILLHQYDIHRRKISEIALAKEVLTDALTGLLNRRGLDKKLTELDGNKEPFIIYYIDLDGFKIINDSFGHGVGDQVLQTVADRLLHCLPENSSACRFGGDEFVVVVQLKHMPVGKEVLAGTLVKSLSDTYYDRSRPMALSASMGIAEYPADASKLSNVILYADAAMYQAKQLGKHRWVNYEEGMEQTILRQSIIAQRLCYAKENGELELYYQPIWEFSDNGRGEIVSFEALLRWHNNELGIVSIEEVIQVAEEIGIIDTIEQWVVKQALSDLLVLRKYTSPGVTMAINLSAIHLREETLPRFLLDLLNSNNLLPKDLVIELTESALIEDLDNEYSVVRQLVDSGIKISIDDFGTGYSSLAYLHHIPAAIVKIDRSFIVQIQNNSKTLQHIQSLIEAHEMNALIEGVETEEQQKILMDYGIKLHQGYLLGRPKPLSYYIESYSSLG